MNTAHLSYLAEYLRPWKFVTLAVGIALLILGSFYCGAPDWDIPISFIMAIFAYFTAPWSMRVLLERRWRLWLVMLFFTWFTVDGCYALYWHFKNPVVLELMRSVNFPASLSLYGMCGIVWLYRGSLRQLVSEIRNHFLILRGNKRRNSNKNAGSKNTGTDLYIDIPGDRYQDREKSEPLSLPPARKAGSVDADGI